MNCSPKVGQGIRRITITNNIAYNFSKTLSNLKKLEKLTIYSPIAKADLPNYLYELPSLKSLKLTTILLLGISKVIITRLTNPQLYGANNVKSK